MTGFESAAACLEELDRLEAETGRRWSMYQDSRSLLFHPVDDHGRARDVACATKKLHTSRSRAKRSLKEMRRRGNPGLTEYACWYSRSGAHYHLGHAPGEQTYLRSGRVYG
jgi:hypothetical protein